ncbi:MAG TPA: hypothetical protein VMZ25_07810 [Terriglobales bacterium]|nr:hypothetical protein [Terriglobales bacterium]
MPRKSNKKSSSRKANTNRTRSTDATETTVTRTIVAKPKPVTNVITEEREITTEPEVEIRRPATLSQALTQPPIAVVKPKTTVRKVQRSTRRVA